MSDERLLMLLLIVVVVWFALDALGLTGSGGSDW